jgi:apolipoprotein N-acyltransferase
MLKTAIARPSKRPQQSATATNTIDSAPHGGPRFFSRTLCLGVAGSLLLWAAFPPLNLPFLAWIAPVPWLWLARTPRLIGRWPYFALWLAGCVHWLLMLEGIRLAHPALYAGWIALSFYLACYLPIFVGLTRVAVHQLKLSIVAAAPIVWVGLELLRGHLITGFSMGLLAHTQAELPLLIQISDLAGGYTLSLVIMLVAACITRTLPLRSPTPDSRLPTRLTYWPLLPTATALTFTFLYGWWRLSQKPPTADRQPLGVALIQGSIDTVFEQSAERARETLRQYEGLTELAAAQQRNLDLIVWPESMFVVPERISGDDKPVAQDDFHLFMASEAARSNANSSLDHPGTMLLVGTSTFVGNPAAFKVYNSALLADREGNVVARYYKTHPVMFGEYIPFADKIPWLYRITPITGGLSIGDGPKRFEVAGLTLSPSICFESTIPHLIRNQLLELARRGTPAGALVNVTNDGWFWGTGILDLHFRCGVFRAVENRKPLIIAANTGISAWIDSSGVILARGSRRRPEVIVAEVQADGRASPYHTLGDYPVHLCAAGCLGLAAWGLRKRKRPGNNRSE